VSLRLSPAAPEKVTTIHINFNSAYNGEVNLLNQAAYTALSYYKKQLVNRKNLVHCVDWQKTIFDGMAKNHTS